MTSLQLREPTLEAGTVALGKGDMKERLVMGMVERAARALCASNGIDPDGMAMDVVPPVKAWRTFTPVVETVLHATTLPGVPILEGGPPEAHPGLHDWALYRKTFGVVGAKAREPTLHVLKEWHVSAAWRTWNAMVEAALKHRDEQDGTGAAVEAGRV